MTEPAADDVAEADTAAAVQQFGSSERQRSIRQLESALRVAEQEVRDAAAALEAEKELVRTMRSKHADEAHDAAAALEAERTLVDAIIRERHDRLIGQQQQQHADASACALQ